MTQKQIFHEIKSELTTWLALRRKFGGMTVKECVNSAAYIVANTVLNNGDTEKTVQIVMWAILDKAY